MAGGTHSPLPVIPPAATASDPRLSVILPALSAVAKGAETSAYLPFSPDFGGRRLQSQDLSSLRLCSFPPFPSPASCRCPCVVPSSSAPL